MLKKLKKIVAVLIIIILLPYIVTIFINGRKVDNNKETDARSELLKQYCIGRLAKEVSSDYEDEMLKAQAIMVRTTVYKEIEEMGSSFAEQDDFGDTIDIDKSWYQKLEKIWEETDDLVLMYENKLALVPFHQVSNGKTRVGSEVLGEDVYPYLKIKECPLDVEADKQMQSKFVDVKGAKIETSDSAGYVLTVKVGEESISGESFRETYGLASSCFELQEFEENTRVITKGVGHGLGLSQYTANEMAKNGKTHKDILQFFFEGTEIKEVAEILWNIE